MIFAEDGQGADETAYTLIPLMVFTKDSRGTRPVHPG